MTRQQRDDFVLKHAGAVVKPVAVIPAPVPAPAPASTSSAASASGAPILDVRRSSGAIPKRKPATEEAPLPSTSSTPSKKRKTKAASSTSNASTPSSSLADRKNAAWERIEELQRQLLAEQQRLARLNFEALPSPSSLAAPPPSLPGAKGRRKK